MTTVEGTIKVHTAKVDVVLVRMHAVRGVLEDDSPGEVRG